MPETRQGKTDGESRQIFPAADSAEMISRAHLINRELKLQQLET